MSLYELKRCDYNLCEVKMETGDTPKDNGWYAIKYCYDVEEGILDGVAFWDGKWNPQYPIGSFFGPFKDKSTAEIFSQQDDESYSGDDLWKVILDDAEKDGPWEFIRDIGFCFFCGELF